MLLIHCNKQVITIITIWMFVNPCLHVFHVIVIVLVSIRP